MQKEQAIIRVYCIESIMMSFGKKHSVPTIILNQQLQKRRIVIFVVYQSPRKNSNCRNGDCNDRTHIKCKKSNVTTISNGGNKWIRWEDTIILVTGLVEIVVKAKMMTEN